MRAIIQPGNLRGIITPPPSKSMMQRACTAALLYHGTTRVINPGTSKDDMAALNIIQQLGATVNTVSDNQLEITSNGITPPTNTIHCGESGLSARLFIPVAALSDSEITVTASGSLLNRPMTEYFKILPKLGVSINSKKECLPMNIRGPLKPGDITIDGSLSSQFLSGLMMVYAFTTTDTVTIHVNNLKSKPYIDLTLHMLAQYGLHVTNHNYGAFTIQPPVFNSNMRPVADIETDWSAAANFVVANAMCGTADLRQMNIDSLQADVAILQVVNDNNLAFDFDATDCPDLVPVLSVYAGYCKGDSTIHGLGRLIHKESNRVESTTAMLAQLGVEHHVEGDTLRVKGGKPFNSSTINSYNDHRIVMAAAVAALKADGPVTITQAEAVEKSYPAFFETLSSAGVHCQLVN